MWVCSVRCLFRLDVRFLFDIQQAPLCLDAGLRSPPQWVYALLVRISFDRFILDSPPSSLLILRNELGFSWFFLLFPIVGLFHLQSSLIPFFKLPILHVCLLLPGKWCRLDFSRPWAISPSFALQNSGISTKYFYIGVNKWDIFQVEFTKIHTLHYSKNMNMTDSSVFIVNSLCACNWDSGIMEIWGVTTRIYTVKIEFLDLFNL